MVLSCVQSVSHDNSSMMFGLFLHPVDSLFEGIPGVNKSALEIASAAYTLLIR